MLHKENNVSSAPILGVISRSVGLVVVVMVGLLGCIIIIIADMGWGSHCRCEGRGREGEGHTVRQTNFCMTLLN